jgi:hypothetical protein
MLDTPLAIATRPNALVNASSPNRSTITMDVREMYADKESPKMSADPRKLLKSWHSAKPIVLNPEAASERLVTTSELTLGLSTSQPTATLPRVLAMPVLDTTKLADSREMPLFSMTMGRYTYGM